MGLIQVPVNRGHADMEHLCDLNHRVLLGVIELSGLVDLLWIHYRRAPTHSATGPGRGQACMCALTDEVTFELCEGGHNRKEESAVGSGRVYGLGQTPKSNVHVGQSLNQLDEILQGAAQTVQPQTTTTSPSRS